MKRSSFTFLVMSICGVLVLSQALLGAESIAGSWKVNLAKSKYSPADLAPKSGTSKMEAVTGGLKVTTDGVDSKGRKLHAEYTTKLDGKDVPSNATIDGKPSPDQDAVAWKKIDDSTYEVVTKLKGKALTTTKIGVAKHGKSRTATVTGKNAQGQTVSNTTVNERQ